MYKNLFLPVSIITATIIGAGIFGLPYVFYKAGFVAGLFYLFLFTAVFIIIHLMYADVISRTDNLHLFAGYAKIYLGETGKWLAALTSIVGMTLILTAYLILAGKFVGLIFPSLSPTYSMLIFWALASIPIFWGVQRLALSEFWITLCIVSIVFLIFFYGIGFTQNTSTVWAADFAYLFLPYGVVLFSLSGRSAIPAVIHYFQKNNELAKKAKQAIILGTALPALIYIIFAIGIINISGTVSEDSLSGLMQNLPLWLTWALGLLGIISIWSTYATLGRDIRKSLEADFNFRIGWWPGITVSLLPLLIYLAGLRNFFQLISLVGGIFIGLESLFIVLIWQQARKINPHKALLKKIPALVPYLLLIVFILGIILEIRK